MTDIEHPHEGDDCQICWLIENSIRPVIEFQTRKKIAQDIEMSKPMLKVKDYVEAELVEFIIGKCVAIARGQK
jgi:hypothetical protein